MSSAVKETAEIIEKMKDLESCLESWGEDVAANDLRDAIAVIEGLLSGLSQYSHLAAENT